MKQKITRSETGRRAFSLSLWLLFSLICTLPLTDAAAAFSDVPEGSWYEPAVTELSEAGYVQGYADGTFRPGQAISAAEFVAAAARCAGLRPVQAQSSHRCAGYLQAALERGWYDWDELPPSGERFDLPISRQLAVKILMRAFLPDIRGDYRTESAKMSDFSTLEGRYYEPVLAAYAAGVIQGDGGNFRPRDPLSRAAACAIICRALRQSGEPAESTPPPPPRSAAAVRGGVSENGWLQVKGAQLCNEAGAPVILRGMSSHGLQWYGQYASAQPIRNTADWGANLFRVAMYTGEGGYLASPDAIRQKAMDAADAAIANDLYVILDWHILSDGNPMEHLEEASSFFTEMARRYQNSPAVLYEICNEPNGAAAWDRDIKPYAEEIVRVIRAQSPRSVILIGSSTWSQDIHLAAASPLSGENLMYTLHFYAGAHGEALRRRIDDVRSAGLPVFVSEWGTSRADGSGGVFLKESEQWLDFLAERNISWANWSLCDKNETSAALLPGTSAERPWTEADLSPSGKLVFSRFPG